MLSKIKFYLIYPFKKGNLATLIIPASLFIMGRIFIHFIGIFFGNYAAIIGLLFNLAIVGFSAGYLTQIVREASNGEEGPPSWEIEQIDLMNVMKGVLPTGISIIEAGIITVLVILIISLFTSTGFLSLLTQKMSLILLVVFSSLIFPFNLLEYSINKDCDIPYLFSFLKVRDIIMMVSVFPIGGLIIGFCFFIPFWKHLFSTFFGFVFIFYLAQIFSFCLGNLFYKARAEI